MTVLQPRAGGLLFFFQAEDGIRDLTVTGVQTCALPISGTAGGAPGPPPIPTNGDSFMSTQEHLQFYIDGQWVPRSEEHTSELQSQSNLVCRLLLEKKKKQSSLAC